MASLAELMCVPCRGGDPPLSPAEIAALHPGLPDWQLVEEAGVPKLRRTFQFEDFAQALAFTNQIGAIAEEQDHHPVLQVAWGKVTVTWWTHAIAGLHRNDFIMAARSDQLYQ